MPEIPQRPGVRPVRRPARPTPPEVERRTAGRPPAAADDRFFRHLVRRWRKGSTAGPRDARLRLMKDEAYRFSGLPRRAEDVGRKFSEVLNERPAAIRVLGSAFELSHLPNRAELRLKDL